MAEPTPGQLNARVSKLEGRMDRAEERLAEHEDQHATHDTTLRGTADKPGVLEEIRRSRESREFWGRVHVGVLLAVVGLLLHAWGFVPKARATLAPALAAVEAPAQAQALTGSASSEGEAPEPDPGQAWPPDPRLAQTVWVRPAGMALHVTAGSRTQAHPQYHLVAVGDARRVVRSLPDTTPGAHVLGANSGTVGLALACGAGATYSAAPAFELRGGVQPLPQQVEDLAAVAAELAIKWGLDLGGTRTLASGARVPVLGTHRDYAVAGGYGAHRFDPGGNLAAQLRAKARWYFTTTKAGKRRAAWVR